MTQLLQYVITRPYLKMHLPQSRRNLGGKGALAPLPPLLYILAKLDPKPYKGLKLLLTLLPPPDFQTILRPCYQGKLKRTCAFAPLSRMVKSS